MLNVKQILRLEPVHATWDDVARPWIVPNEIYMGQGSIQKAYVE
jgi:hypothetical protein